MALETKTYDEFEARVKAFLGWDELFTADATILNQFFNSRYREINDVMDWPAALVYGEERAVTSNVIPYTDSTVANADIDEFIEVYRDDPKLSIRPRKVPYKIVNSGARIISLTDLDTGYVNYKQRFTELDGATGTETFPYDFFEYICHGVLADWYRSEGDTERAIVEDRVAQTRMDDQINKLQRISEQYTYYKTHGSMQGRNY